MSDATINLQRIRKQYGTLGKTAPAVRDVTLAIHPGEVTALMGPSGSGKTTLLSIIGGLLAPTAGEITVAGERLDTCDETGRQQFRRRNIGFIFQSYNLLSALTAIENIRVALALRGAPECDAIRLLESVGLANKANAYPEELSGGQRQRISIARALAGDPPLLLADEPTAALDEHHRKRVMDLLCARAKNAGTTVVVVTHDPRVRDCAGRVIEMEDGRLKRIVRRVPPDQARTGKWTVTRGGTVVAEVAAR